MTIAADSRPSAPPPGILIVGGYGTVGRQIARLLLRDYGPRLLIGGRHERKAARLTRSLGHGAQPRRLDLTDPASFPGALNAVGLVIMCLDTADLNFPLACITRGIHYIDITATYPVIERLEMLNDLARVHGATILCSVGLAPGLTNLLAKACVQNAPAPVTALNIHLLLGLGDRHGRAALAWMVDRLHRPYNVQEIDGVRQVLVFDEQSQTKFPAPFCTRATYRFDFSDQHSLPATLGVAAVSTWSTFDRRFRNCARRPRHRDRRQRDSPNVADRRASA